MSTIGCLSNNEIPIILLSIENHQSNKMHA